MTAGYRELRQYPFFVMLCSLVILMLLSPVVEVAGLQRWPIVLMFALVILSAVNAASDKRIHVLIGIGLAAPAFVLNLTELVTANYVLLDLIGDLLLMCLLLLTLGVMFARILRARESDFDLLCGAAAIYLLFGVIWATSYSVIEKLAPGSFANLETDDVRNWTQFLYFSLTTLTTLGYGDLLPVNPVARIWSVLEAVAGVFYLGIMISRLVSLYRR